MTDERDIAAWLARVRVHQEVLNDAITKLSADPTGNPFPASDATPIGHVRGLAHKLSDVLFEGFAIVSPFYMPDVVRQYPGAVVRRAPRPETPLEDLA